MSPGALMDSTQRTQPGRGWSGMALPAAVAVAVLLPVLLVIFAVLVFTLPASVPADDAHRSDVILGLAFIADGAVGVLLMRRRPENPVGWILAATAILLAAAQIGPDYTLHWLYAKDVPEALIVPLLVGTTAAGYAAGEVLLVI